MKIETRPIATGYVAEATKETQYTTYHTEGTGSTELEAIQQAYEYMKEIDNGQASTRL